MNESCRLDGKGGETPARATLERRPAARMCLPPTQQLVHASPVELAVALRVLLGAGLREERLLLDGTGTRTLWIPPGCGLLPALNYETHY